MSPPAPAASPLARIARNGGLNASADVLTKLFALAFFTLIARSYGASSFGHYVFALATTSLIWVFGGLGLDRMATRDIARNPDAMRRLVVPLGVMKATFALLATGILTGVLVLSGEDAEATRLVLILGSAVAFGLAASVVLSVFAANERMEYVFLVRVPWSLATTITGIVVILLGGSLELAASTASLGALVGLLLAWTVLLRHYGRPERVLRLPEWPRILREAFPFGAQEMLGQVIFRLDIVILAAFAASAVVGDYGAAFRLIEATLFIAWSVGFAAEPMFAYVEADDGARPLTRILEGASKLVLLVMAPIATVLCVCAEPIVSLLYGLDEHAAAVGLLQLLAPALAFYAVGHLAGLVVLLRRPARDTLLLSGGVAVINVVACLALIPAFEARGAAVSTLVAEGLLAAGGLLLCRRVTGPLRLRWTFGTPLAGAAVMALVMLPVAGDLWLAVPLGAVAYLATVALLEFRRLPEDLRLFRSLRSTRPGAALALVEEPVVG